MADVRISDIAAELGYSSKEIIEKAHEMGLRQIKGANSVVSVEDAEAIYNYVKNGGQIVKKIKPKNVKKSTQKDINLEDKLEKKSKKLTSKTLKQKSEEVAETSQKIKSKNKPSIDTTNKDINLATNTKSLEEKKIEDKKDIVEDVGLNLKSEKGPKKLETLAATTLNKRRGIVIVKKKQSVSEFPKKEPTKKLNEGLDAIFSNTQSTLKKKKKDKKSVVISKKDDIQKMEFLDNRQMADISIDDDDEFILPDLTVSSIKVEEKTQTKKQQVFKTSQNKYTNQEINISRGSRKKHKKQPKNETKENITSVNISKEIRVYEFAEKLGKQPSEIISKLFMLGMMTTKNDFLDEDAIEILADEFNVEVNIIDEALDFDYVKAYEEDENSQSDLVLRAPVITIMGHVDHGKTSLLDYIRKTRVATGEAGGITQHVGAYMVNKNGKTITFIDTPGHEAFTSMRQRGAKVTDIVIIVVAADDGVKPQTKEAISHAKAAGVPIIIAINKMDKDSANPDLVKTGLSELDIMPIEWGGSYEFVPISAKTGMGIDDLLEIVLLQADLLELKANPNNKAKATVVESSLQKGRGTVATIIVQNGTLRVGDTVVAGVAYGRIKAITDDNGKALKELKPGECGVIVGLSEVPESGETLISVDSEKEAREYANKKHEYLRQKELSKSTKVTIDELSAKIAEGEIKTLPVIVKADVGGSLEAIKASLDKLRNDEIKVNIIHSGIGGITQNDIGLASASDNCIILGFNVRPTGDIKERAKERGVEIKTYNVIYNLLDDVKSVLSGMMSPIISEEELGQAEIRQVINVPKVGQIAGCMVTDGKITRGAKIRVIRDGVVIFEGNISSLKRFKDDAREVAKGFECGVGIEGFNDMKEGDFIESFEQKKEQASL
ncbi:translation initiation factor IF-2 [Campylobacter sp. FMV-PI01]|uniref:Translation initiation factor IF-2 n=1 Tax=Campylobacter portucalensis TaxID=2608384 RepID=A0A6L5WHD1_9BACT|nr:translation initiation factor IF-2 [Campylobacter portucalensis]MSN95832.1 translation initiation factor IF-2 [Campylobacter portucalensis]